MLRLLVDLKNQLGKTIMLITHNAALADAADRVVRLRSGQIVEMHDNPHLSRRRKSSGETSSIAKCCANSSPPRGCCWRSPA